MYITSRSQVYSKRVLRFILRFGSIKVILLVSATLQNLRWIPWTALLKYHRNTSALSRRQFPHLLLPHLFSEKHQDGRGARSNVCHDVLGHLLQTEAPGGKDPGGVQAGAGVPAAAAFCRQGHAGRGGGGGFRSTSREITSGAKAERDVPNVVQEQRWCQKAITRIYDCTKQNMLTCKNQHLSTDCWVPPHVETTLTSSYWIQAWSCRPEEWEAAGRRAGGSCQVCRGSGSRMWAAPLNDEVLHYVLCLNQEEMCVSGRGSEEGTPRLHTEHRVRGF